VRILLIGGNGFIGRRVSEEFAKSNHAVTVLHRSKNPSLWRGDVDEIIGDANHLVEHRHELQRLSPDVVVNFVLSSGRQVEEMMLTLRGIAGRVVAISSMDVYRACGILHRTESGDLQALPLTEESELRTQPAYSPEQVEMGKKIFSWMTDDYDKIPVEHVVMADPEISGTVLRLPMVYGPGDPLHRFFPVIKRITDGRRKILLQQECAQWRGTKSFVENVAQAITLAAVSPKARGRIYNVAERDSLTELEWTHLVAKEMNWDGEVVVIPKDRTPRHLVNDDANWAQHWVASSQRIREELGYDEQVARPEALRRTISWELDHPPAEISPALFDYKAEDAALA
jgi:nucleoside-diphosphate-sugar epimerase